MISVVIPPVLQYQKIIYLVDQLVPLVRGT